MPGYPRRLAQPCLLGVSREQAHRVYRDSKGLYREYIGVIYSLLFAAKQQQAWPFRIVGSLGNSHHRFGPVGQSIRLGPHPLCVTTMDNGNRSRNPVNF